MPATRKVWSSWNFLGSSSPEQQAQAVCVSYWANRLQELPPGAPDMFVTLNPPRPPAEDKVIRALTLSHPVFRCVAGEASKHQGGAYSVTRGSAWAWACTLGCMYVCARSALPRT